MASVMFATIPLATQLIASLSGQERLTFKGMPGALVSQRARPARSLSPR